MSVGQPSLHISSASAVTGVEPACWYAVHTRARHEKRVAERLAEQGMTSFLPLVKETHRWSDRKKTVEIPLFSCYVFVRMRSRVRSHPRKASL